jgi:uncharacterized protein (TIGR02118 family)
LLLVHGWRRNPKKGNGASFRGRDKKKMIKVSVFYPGGAGSTFDMNYYLNRHIPMVLAKLGPACKSAAVEQDVGGATPSSPPAFSAMGHLYFDSVEAFQGAFGPHARDHGRHP